MGTINEKKHDRLTRLGPVSLSVPIVEYWAVRPVQAREPDTFAVLGRLLTSARLSRSRFLGGHEDLILLVLLLYEGMYVSTCTWHLVVELQFKLSTNTVACVP